MAKAKNSVIAGDYLGYSVSSGLFTPSLIKARAIPDSVALDNTNVSCVELITDEHRKSAASGIARGLVGGALLGPVGMMAGGLSAKSKGIYTIAIQFKDGKTSLVEVNDKIYKAIAKSCFKYHNKQALTPAANKIETKDSTESLPSNAADRDIAQSVIKTIDAYFNGEANLESTDDEITQYYLAIADMTLESNVSYKIFMEICDISTGLSRILLGEEFDITTMKEHRNTLAKLIGLPEVNTISKTITTPPTTSAADEIRKFKELLDDGIITEEEFAAKKKQLLGL